MKVLIVGDKPSNLNKDPNIAFIGAKCYSRLLNWIYKLNIKNYQLVNSNDLELLTSTIEYYKPNKIIALGNNASKRLIKLNILHYKLPHPSGLNRKLNYKEYIDYCIKRCYNYIHE